MTIALVGATGRTGHRIIAAAQAAGQPLTVHARDALRLPQGGAGLNVVTGALDDPAVLDRLLEGATAVISAMGTTGRKANTVLSDTTRALTKGMERRGVARFVCVTSMGCGDSLGQVRSRVMRFIIATIGKQIWADKDRQERAVAESTLDWLLVRPGGLTDKPALGTFAVLAPHEMPGKGQMIPRDNVAQFCLDEAMAPKRHREAVTLMPAG